MSRKAKRIVQLVVAFMLVAVFALAPSVEAFAAGSFSGGTGLQNSMNGLRSGGSFITSPSINQNAVATSVTVNSLAISNGSDPFNLIITAPNGRDVVIQRFARGASFPVTINLPANTAAHGRWQVSIQHIPTLGGTGVSTITSGRITVNWR